MWLILLADNTMSLSAVLPVFWRSVFLSVLRVKWLPTGHWQYLQYKPQVGLGLLCHVLTSGMWDWKLGMHKQFQCRKKFSHFINFIWVLSSMEECLLVITVHLYAWGGGTIHSS